MPLLFSIFSFTDGRTMEGMLLAAGTDYMRLAIPGLADTMVIRQVAGYWTTEDGERIELESVMTYSESDLLGSACVGRRAFSAT
jgi:hypothetical protein